MDLVTSLDLTQHYTHYDLVPPLLMSTQLLIGSFSKTAQPSSLAIGRCFPQIHHDWSIYLHRRLSPGGREEVNIRPAKGFSGVSDWL